VTRTAAETQHAVRGVSSGGYEGRCEEAQVRVTGTNDVSNDGARGAGSTG